MLHNRIKILKIEFVKLLGIYSEMCELVMERIWCCIRSYGCHLAISFLIVNGKPSFLLRTILLRLYNIHPYIQRSQHSWKTTHDSIQTTIQFSVKLETFGFWEFHVFKRPKRRLLYGDEVIKCVLNDSLPKRIRLLTGIVDVQINRQTELWNWSCLNLY